MKKQPQELTVRTEKMVYGGPALARADRFVVFVDDALPNETVRARIYKKKKQFAFGRAVEILEAAPERIPSDCPWTGDCGGCTYRHCVYSAQLRFKQEVLAEALHGVAGATAALRAMVPAPATQDYRNKMVFTFGATPAGELRLGLHRRGSFMHIIPADTCWLQSAASREIVQRAQALAKQLNVPAFHEIKKTPGLRTLTVREARGTGQRMVELVTTTVYPGLAEGVPAQLDELADTIYLSTDTNIYGSARPEQRMLLKGTGIIEETLNGLRFQIGPDTFFQSNSDQAAALFRRLTELAIQHGRPRVALDLFCGTGPIAMHLAAHADRVIAVENWMPSVQALRDNLALNHIQNVEVVTADVNQAPPPDIPARMDLAVVDPPRPGLSPQAIEWLCALQPQSVIYVSCNPATLARDLKRLLQAPYQIETVEPFDLFPHTYHMETLVLLRRTSEPA